MKGCWTSCITVWGALLTYFTEKLAKIIFLNGKVSRNAPKGKQQMKKQLFKQICKNLVRKMRVCVIWTKTTFSSSSLSSVKQRLHDTLRPPRRQGSFSSPPLVGGFYSPEQDVSISYPARSHLLLRLSPGWVQSINEGTSPLRLHSWNGDSTLGMTCWEYLCPMALTPVHEVVAPCQERQAPAAAIPIHQTLST